MRKGIPDSLRATVWPRFTGALEAMKAAPPGLYRQRLAEPCELADVISRDIARTFPNHLMFRDELGSAGGDGEEVSGSSSGRQSLYNVLKAYANHDKHVGYCQVSSLIHAVTLSHASITALPHPLRVCVVLPLLCVCRVWGSSWACS